MAHLLEGQALLVERILASLSFPHIRSLAVPQTGQTYSQLLGDTGGTLDSAVLEGEHGLIALSISCISFMFRNSILSKSIGYVCGNDASLRRDQPGRRGWRRRSGSRTQRTVLLAEKMTGQILYSLRMGDGSFQ